MRIVAAVAWLALGMALLGAAPALAQNRVALVVGIDRYAHLPAEHQLAKAGNDSDAVGNALQQSGFEVMRGRDLGLAALRSLIADFAGRLNGGDTAALVFVGRGVALDGVNYLLPADVPGVDSAALLRGSAIAETEVVDKIRARRVGLTVMIVDAARDNPFQGADGNPIGSGRGLAETRWPDDVFSLYSAAPGQVSLERLHADDTHRHSIFGRVLVEHLRNPRLTLRELGTGVAERVTELARVVGPDIDRPGPHAQTVTFAGGAAAAQTRLGAASASRPQPASPWPPQSGSLTPSTSPGVPFESKAIPTVPIGPSGAPAPSTSFAARPAAPSAAVPSPPGPARAVLYEEDANDPMGRRAIGSARWRVARGPGAGDITVQVDVEVPERDGKVSVSWRRNDDASLPASHMIEVRATMHHPVANVPGVLLKVAEATRGVPLAGLSVKVTTGHFLIGLSSVKSDVERNLGLMRDRAYFDIPLVFDNGKRAILAIEKGRDGDEACRQAFAVWEGSAGR